MKDFEGKVVLVVNVASQCGFTKQYDGLEALYKKYKDQGFVVIGFPCNQFGGQVCCMCAVPLVSCGNKLSLRGPLGVASAQSGMFVIDTELTVLSLSLPYLSLSLSLIPGIALLQEPGTNEGKDDSMQCNRSSASTPQSFHFCMSLTHYYIPFFAMTRD